MDTVVRIVVCASALAAVSTAKAATLYVSNTGSTGSYSSIQAAINAAESGDTIEVEPGTYTEFRLVSKDLTFRSSSETGMVVVDGYDRRRPMACTQVTSDTTFLNFVFQNGRTTSGKNGGGVHLTAASPVFTNCTFQDNLSWEGGGVYMNNSSPSFISCSFIGNAAMKDGGALFSQGPLAAVDSDRKPRVDFEDCLFEGNYATYNGGALSLWNSVAECDGVIFLDNIAGWWGGGVYGIFYSEYRLRDSSLSGNVAGNLGGSVGLWYRCLLEIADSELEDGDANLGGHVWAHDHCVVRAEHSTFDRGTAYSSGGHLLASRSTVSLEGNVFSQGWAGDSGGSLYLYEGRYDGWENEFRESTAPVGAMMYCLVNETRIDDSVFDTSVSAYQESHRDGRAFSFLDSVLLCNNTVFQSLETTANRARSLVLHRGGDAVYGSCEISDSTISSAHRTASIMQVDQGANVVLQSCLFQDNNGAPACSVVRNLSSTLTVDASRFESNGGSSSGPGSWFRHAVVHTAGISAQTEIGNSSFCGNAMRDTFGPWTDLGGNAYLTSCP